MRLLPITLLLAAACATKPPQDTPVVTIDNLQRIERGKPVIIEIPAGKRLPLYVKAETPFLHVEKGDPALDLVFDRTVYWYAPQPDRISYDKKSWKRITDLYAGRFEIGVRQTGEGTRAEASLEMIARR